MRMARAYRIAAPEFRDRARGGDADLAAELDPIRRLWA
jgi:hypothetical protein